MSDGAVETLGPEAFGDVVALRRAVYPDKPVDEAELRWIYGGGPSGPARLLGIRDRGRLVALNVLLPRDLTVDGARVPSSLIVDAMTHPAARGRGHLYALATRCRELSEAEGFVACGYPNARSERGYVRAGFRAAHQVTGGSLDLSTAPALPALFFRDPADWPVVTAETIPPLPELWPIPSRVGVHRDAAYYRWRLARPGAHYRAWLSPDRRALVVAKRYGEDTVNMVELVTGELRHTRTATRLVIDWAREVGATRITAWGRHLSQAELFVEAGFDLTHGPRVEILAGAVTPPLLDVDGWHTGQLDCDVF